MPMQLYEEGARLLDGQRYVQSSGISGLRCVTTEAEQAARCRFTSPYRV